MRARVCIVQSSGVSFAILCKASETMASDSEVESKVSATASQSTLALEPMVGRGAGVGDVGDGKAMSPTPTPAEEASSARVARRKMSVTSMSTARR